MSIDTLLAESSIRSVLALGRIGGASADRESEVEEVLERFWNALEDRIEPGKHMPDRPRRRLQRHEEALVVVRLLCLGKSSVNSVAVLGVEHDQEETGYRFKTDRRAEAFKLPGLDPSVAPRRMERNHTVFWNSFLVELRGFLERNRTPQGESSNSSSGNELGSPNVWRNHAQGGHRSRLLSDTQTLEGVAGSLAQALDRAPRHYPEHLTPTELVKSLSLSAPDLQRLSRETAAVGLTSGYAPEKGAPALGVLDHTRRAIVLGDPGGGKSTILTAYTVGVLRETAAPRALFVRLADVFDDDQAGRTRLGSYREAIELLVRAALRRLPPNMITEDAFVDALDSADASLVLDGLDEVPRKRLGGIEHLLEILSDYPGRVVLSSRVAGYRKPRGDWNEYWVSQLTKAQAVEFLERWFDGRPVERRQRAVDALQTLVQANAIRTPVVLGLLASVADDNRQNMPHTVTGLYEQFVSKHVQLEWRDESLLRDSAEVTGATLFGSQVAAYMAGEFTEVQRSSWRETITRNELNVKFSKKNPDELEALIRLDGLLLVPFGVESAENYQEFRWIHRTVQEHLVGRNLMGRFEDQPEVTLNWIVDAAQTPDPWQEPLTHFMAMLRPAQRRTVADRILAEARRGDPAGALLTFLFESFRDVAPSDKLRIEIAEALCRAGRWQEALEIHQETAEERLLEQAEQRVFPSTTWRMRRGAVRISPRTRNLILRRLELCLEEPATLPIPAADLRTVITEAEGINQERAHTAAITAHRTGIVGIDRSWVLTKEPSQEVLEATLDNILTTDWPEPQLSLLRDAFSDYGGRLPNAGLLNDELSVQIAYHLERAGIAGEVLIDQETEFLTALAEGAHGALGALLLGVEAWHGKGSSNAEAEDTRAASFASDPSPWYGLGCRVYDARRARRQPRSKNARTLSMNDTDALLADCGELSWDMTASKQALDGHSALVSVIIGARDGEIEIPVVSLLGLYRECRSRMVNQRAAGVYYLSLCTILKEELLRDPRDVLRTIAEEDASYWDEQTLMSLITSDYADHLTPDLAIRLCSWAGASGIGVMHCIKNYLRKPGRAEALVKVVPTDVLQIPSNLEALATVLWENGTLSKHRSTVLSLPA